MYFQILANVAYIIIDSSEEADLNYGTWKKVLIFVGVLRVRQDIADILTDC